MAEFITKKEFQEKIDELVKAVAGMPDDKTAVICEACHVIKKITPKRGYNPELRCWCDYESQEIE